MQYHMTSYRHSERGYWIPCRARTLTGAKREATRRYSGGYLDAELQIAVGDDVTGPRFLVATKRTGQKWKYTTV